MKIILLSGGSGKRLWPLSNDVRSKQFLKLLPAPEGKTESMIQRVVRQIRESGLTDSITIATGETQIDMIKSQLGTDIEVVTEPTRRDTFPAIALAAMYLKDKGVSLDEAVVVMPCDVFTDSGYFETIMKMAQAVDANVAKLVLMGISPTSASTKYGYILPASPQEERGIYHVERFVEKPTTAYAEELIGQNAFWNGGVFSFKLGHMVDLIEKYMPKTSSQKLKENFDRLPKISFDYEVVEKTDSIAVVPFDGLWKDLGTWDALSEHLPKAISGYVVNAPDVRHTHVVNELDLPIVCVGVDNLIVSASPDGILIADKNSSENIKEHVSVIHARPMFEERRWGFYKVLGHTEYEDGHQSLTKLLHLNPGCSISYQVHAQRDEVWSFVDGEALLVIDDAIIKVGRGYVANIKAGQKHAVRAITPVEVIEVQAGTELVEEDIKRFDWSWD